MPADHQRCWLCSSPDLVIAKPDDLTGALDSQSFAITDSHYGQTGEIQRCSVCGFLQCSRLDEVLEYYEGLEDPEYEEGRPHRGLQMEKLLESLSQPSEGASLLDVGAGSGMLVEQALKKGYRAEGIEPSHWLAGKARQLGLPVELGVLPSAKLHPPYDVVSLVDVIEHVSDPIDMLVQARKVLADDGVLLIVTPDVSSIVARVLGFRWWHFRVAHICYFNRTTLDLALRTAGFQIKSFKRPTWYFSADYLTERVNCYLPSWFQLPIPKFLRSIVIPLNLGDSILAVAVRSDAA